MYKVCVSRFVLGNCDGGVQSCSKHTHIFNTQHSFELLWRSAMASKFGEKFPGALYMLHKHALVLLNQKHYMYCEMKKKHISKE